MINNLQAKKCAKNTLFVLAIGMVITGCSNRITSNAPEQHQTPHYLDEEIKDLSIQLIDEQRRLANIRQANQQKKQHAQIAQSSAPESAIFAGLETKRTIECQGCDIKVVAQAIAVLLGWDVNSVYELNRKPAQGVPVTIKLENEPLRRALEQIKHQAGHMMDLRIDPNFKSMVIEYKIVGR